METIRIKLTVAYDGTNYAGWQVQKTGVGVQQKLEEALTRLFLGVQRVHSSSRTDTGVHALGMVVHVDIPRSGRMMTPRKLALALNAFLPEDVRVLAAQERESEFHARFTACGKQYRYFVWNHAAQNPLLRHQAWHVPRRLDLVRMREAARIFIGTHDFRSFAASRNYTIKDTVRTLTRFDVRKNGALVTFVIEADGFLYKMCRGLAGTVVQVGLGKVAVEELPQILDAQDRRSAGMTAPAKGLVLWRVFYPRKMREVRGMPGAGKRISLNEDELE